MSEDLDALNARGLASILIGFPLRVEQEYQGESSFVIQGEPSGQRLNVVDFVPSQTATTNVERNQELCFGLHGDQSGHRLKLSPFE